MVWGPPASAQARPEPPFQVGLGTGVRCGNVHASAGRYAGAQPEPPPHLTKDGNAVHRDSLWHCHCYTTTTTSATITLRRARARGAGERGRRRQEEQEKQEAARRREGEQEEAEGAGGAGASGARGGSRTSKDVYCLLLCSTPQHSPTSTSQPPQLHPAVLDTQRVHSPNLLPGRV